MTWAVDKAWLINRHMGMVVYFANRYVGVGVDHEDLVAAGKCGLLIALSKFDPSQGIKFGQYARWWVLAKVGDAAAFEGRVVRVPKEVLAERWRDGSLTREKSRSMDRPFNFLSTSIPCSSLPSTLHETMPGPEHDFDSGEERVRIWGEVAKKLLERESYIVGRRMVQCDTLDEIAADMGLSRERVRQLEARALRKLEKSQVLRELAEAV